MWRSNAAKLAHILRAEEFTLLLDRYAKLDLFTTQHADIRSEFAEARQRNSDNPLSWGGAKATFMTHTSAAWEKCREIEQTFCARETVLTLDG